MPEAYKHILGVQCLVSFLGYTFPLYNTREFNRTRTCTRPLDPTTLPETEPAWAGLRTVRAMLNAGWPALIAALSFLLTTNLSARSRRRLPSYCPRHVTRSSPPSRKLHSHHPSLPRSMNRSRLRCAPPSHSRHSLSVWREEVVVAPHHSHQDLARAIWHTDGRSSLPCMS
jgi:hypothetical protein